MVEKRTWSRPASSGDGEIFSRLWVGEEKKAVLQIAHGMAEHSGRYDAFATYLAEHGFVVCMEDHAGHGKSAVVKGHFADENGWEFVLSDMKNLMDEVTEEYPGLPVFLMGHSMGSFLSRSYVVRYGQGLSGCVLSGTMGPNPALFLGRLLAAAQMAVCGKQSRGRLIDKLTMGNSNRRIKNPVNQFAWLSTVDEECIRYSSDPDCGFEFTAAGYADLFSGLQEVNGKNWAARVPQELPILLIAGTDDPVGDYGRGPKIVYKRLKDTGHAVRIKLYPGRRHELLNEGNREEVYRDVRRWLERHMV